MPSVPKRNVSPTCTFFAPRMKARQCEPSMRLCRVASIAGSVDPRPIRLPESRAAMTLLSLTTKQSPGRNRSGRSAMFRSSSSTACPDFTTSSRAASRGLAGRSAMRSVGRSKSKRSVRMVARQIYCFILPLHFLNIGIGAPDEMNLPSVIKAVPPPGCASPDCKSYLRSRPDMTSVLSPSGGRTSK